MVIIFDLLKVAMLIVLWLLADRFAKIGWKMLLTQWRRVLRAFLFLILTLVFIALMHYTQILN